MGYLLGSFFGKRASEDKACCKDSYWSIGTVVDPKSNHYIGILRRHVYFEVHPSPIASHRQCLSSVERIGIDQFLDVPMNLNPFESSD